MKKMKHMISLTGLYLLLSFAGGDALAGPGGQGGGGEKGKMGKHGKMQGGKRQHKMMKEMESLGLTDEQKNQMKTLHEGHRAEMEASRESSKAVQDEFFNAMQSPDKSDADLTVLHDKFVASKSEKMRKKFQHMLQVRQLLTAEQRTKFRGMMREGPEED